MRHDLARDHKTLLLLAAQAILPERTSIAPVRNGTASGRRSRLRRGRPRERGSEIWKIESSNISCDTTKTDCGAQAHHLRDSWSATSHARSTPGSTADEEVIDGAVGVCRPASRPR